MFEVMVDSFFHAAHAVSTPAGAMEPTHWHRWRVQVVFAGETLDEHGFLVDFVPAQEQLNKITAAFEGRNLNDQAWLERQPPSSEVIARRVFELLSAHDWHRARLDRVIVHEAPGCSAAYRQRE